MDWNKTIFLAHANEDKPMVRSIYRELKLMGFEPWLDEESIMPGSKWEQKVREAIANSRYVIVFISKSSVQRQAVVHRELRLALRELESKPPDQYNLLPVLLEEMDIPEFQVGTVNLRDYNVTRFYLSHEREKFYAFLRKKMERANIELGPAGPNFADIQKMISMGKTKEAIDAMLQIATKSEDFAGFENAIILQSSRFYQLNKLEMTKTIRFDERQIEANHINQKLLEILKQMKLLVDP